MHQKREPMKAIMVSLIISTLSIATLLGCTGPAEPSVEQARSEFADHMKSRAKGAEQALPYMLDEKWPKSVGEILDLTKTNSENLSRDGQKLYVVHFKAAAKLKPGWGWLHKSGGSSWKPGFYEAEFFRNSKYYEEFPPGAIFITNGTIEFRQSEKGWIGGSVKLRSYNYCSASSSPSECYTSKGW